MLRPSPKQEALEAGGAGLEASLAQATGDTSDAPLPAAPAVPAPAPVPAIGTHRSAAAAHLAAGPPQLALLLHDAVQHADLAASLAAEQEDLAGAACAAPAAGEAPAPRQHRPPLPSDWGVAEALLPGAAASAAAAEGTAAPASPGAAAQPESLDATAAYLHDREAALRRLSQEAAAEREEDAPAAPHAAPAPAAAGVALPGAPAAPDGGPTPMHPSQSLGGLREPPPSPISGSGGRSPAAGGAGDVAAPAVAAAVAASTAAEEPPPEMTETDVEEDEGEEGGGQRASSPGACRPIWIWHRGACRWAGRRAGACPPSRIPHG